MMEQMSEEEWVENQRKQKYWSLEIAKVVAEMPPHSARALKELFNRPFDEKNPEAFIQQIIKDGESIPEMNRTTLLFTKLIQQSCCLLHAMISLMSAFLTHKIQDEVPQSSSLH